MRRLGAVLLLLLALSACADGGTTGEGGSSQAPPRSELSPDDDTQGEAVDVVAVCDEVAGALKGYPSQSSIDAVSQAVEEPALQNDPDFDDIFGGLVAALGEDDAERIDETLPDVRVGCRDAGSDFTVSLG